MEFYNNTLYSIKPKNYNNLFSTSNHKNKKLLSRNIYTFEYNKKGNNTNNYITQNTLQDQCNINSFNFYKTDILPFPKFPKIKNINKFSKNKLLSRKIKKKKNIFSIKYLELLKDINNEQILKNFYFLKANKKSINNNYSNNQTQK